MAADRRNGKELLALEAAEGRKDYISTLPTELLSSILSLIPIKEAVRTSILSKKWIDIWKEMPVLKLDPNFGNDRYTNSQGVYYFNADDEFFSVLEWLNNVQRILCSRHNPIPKCYFWHDLCDQPVLVNHAITQLMEVGVHELKLMNSSDKRFALTPSVFKSPFLKFLSVRGCRLKFPCSFKLVETNLISITFQQTLLTDDTIYRLVSACKSLENFELRHCKGLQNVKINAPNLRCFMITSHLPVSICLEYVPHLEEVSILFIAHRRSMPWRSKRTSFMAFLWSLVGVENLSMELTPKAAQGLLEGIAWEKIHSPLHNLKQLKLGISLANMNQVLFLAFMLRNSGYLEEIKIWVKRSDILGSPSKLDYWETHDSFQCLTHYVKNIQIDEVNLDNEYDIEFLKYLIMNTPVLERMSVSYYGSWRSRVFVAEELQKLRMASPNAHLDMSQSRRWNIG